MNLLKCKGKFSLSLIHRETGPIPQAILICDRTDQNTGPLIAEPPILTHLALSRHIAPLIASRAPSQADAPQQISPCIGMASCAESGRIFATAAADITQTTSLVMGVVELAIRAATEAEIGAIGQEEARVADRAGKSGPAEASETLEGAGIAVHGDIQASCIGDEDLVVVIQGTIAGVVGHVGVEPIRAGLGVACEVQQVGLVAPGCEAAGAGVRVDAL